MAKAELVMVEWLDSCQPHSSWRRYDGPKSVEAGVCLCNSVGWVVREDPEELVLVPSVGLISGSAIGQVSGAFAIPKRAVIARSTLKLVNGRRKTGKTLRRLLKQYA